MSLSSFLDEEEISPHESAWRSRDWDAVETLTKEYTKTAENTLFAILDQLNDKKQRLMVSSLDSYSKYMIDNAMSQHVDTMYQAYVMNLVGSGLPDQAHYDFYLYSVRKGRRTGAWAKLTEDHEEKVLLALLRKIYGVNNKLAIEYKEELIELGKLDWFKRKYQKVAISLLGDVVKNKTEQKKVEQKIKKW